MDQFNNIGSISKLEFAPSSGIVTSIPDASNIVTIYDDSSYVNLNIIHQSASIDQTHVFVNEGNEYVISASWVMAKVSADNNLSIKDLLNKPVSLRLTDANGVAYIIGDNRYPAYIKIGRFIPKAADGLNHYLFNVNYVSRYPLMILG